MCSENIHCNNSLGNESYAEFVCSRAINFQWIWSDENDVPSPHLTILAGKCEKIRFKLSTTKTFFCIPSLNENGMKL